jgi:bifunctional non-homologous end joining protein LigD
MAGVRPPPRTRGQTAPDSESTLQPLRFIPTMQPTLVDDPPEGGDWLHEIKYDGYRTQLHLEHGTVRALTRNGHDWTAKYPTIVRDARVIPAQQAIIDGEICVQDERGVTDFAKLPEAIRNSPQDLVFFAFDLLHLDGKDLRSAPLEERRARLRFLLTQVPGSRLVMSDEYAGDGRQFFELADRHGLEGIVSKRKGSRYISGPTMAWLKTKCWHTETFEIIGVERDKTGVPYALLADKTGYRGTAFIGVPGDMRDSFWRFVEKREGLPPGGLRRPKATWLQPGMVATVRYLRGSDKLRHAVVQRVEVDR